MATKTLLLANDNSGSDMKSWTKTYYASDINAWVADNIPAHSTINSVIFNCIVYKSASLVFGDANVKVGAVQIFSNTGDVSAESRGGLPISESIKNFVASETSTSGYINGDIAVTAYHGTASPTWYIKDVSIVFDYTPPDNIYIGTEPISEIFIGTQEIAEVYIGTTKIYGYE